MPHRSPIFRAATAAVFLACSGLPAVRAQEPAATVTPVPSVTPTPAPPLSLGISAAPAATPLFTPGLPLATPTDADAARAATPAPKPDATIENSVVKIFATARYPDPYRPWTKQAPKDFTGSGAIIAGHRILTNAHVVLYASQIQVQANQAGRQGQRHRWKPSRPASTSPCSSSMTNLSSTRTPRCRWPRRCPTSRMPSWSMVTRKGGTSLSITKGIVSRIEFVPYNGPIVKGLRIQVDSAINPGNSGGPAVVGDTDDRPRLQQARGRRGEHRLHHPRRGDRAFPRGHRRRQIRRQTRHVRPLPDAGESGAARVPEAG